MSLWSDVLEGFGEFDVAIGRVDGQAVVTVWGEVDIATAPQLWRALETVLDEGQRRLVLDFANLRFIDASGLRVIAAAQERCRAAGGELAVRSASAFTLKLFRITGMDKTLRIETPGPPMSYQREGQPRLLEPYALPLLEGPEEAAVV